MSSSSDTSGDLGAPGDIANYSSRSLLVNLVCRVVFPIIANLACWVPMRILWRNGEFAAVVFIITVMALNIDTIAMALIWRNDNIAMWWPGYGLCDVHNYYYTFLIILYASSNMAIMRNLAIQVGMLRANPLTHQEKRRRNLIQALIMFPVPIIAVAWVYPITVVRYVIGTLVGCSLRTDNSWPAIVFIDLPQTIFAVGSTYYAAVTYFRFREVRKMTRTALMSNSKATARSNRTTRKLYLMALFILIPYLPLTVAFFVATLVDTLPLSPYSYYRIHVENNPYIWSSILLIPSSDINFTYLNAKYIPIITAIPVFWFFGLTKDTINIYRKYLLALGFGKLFPSLYQEYDPDRPRDSGNTWLLGSSSRTTQVDRHESLGTIPGSQIPNLVGTTSKDGGKQSHPSIGLPDTALKNIDLEAGLAESSLQSPARFPPAATSTRNSEPIVIPARNHWFMRKHLFFQVPLKFLPIPSLRKKDTKQDGEITGAMVSVRQASGHSFPSHEMRETSRGDWSLTPDCARVDTTLISSEDETHLYDNKHEGLGAESSTHGVVVQT